jgi:16S rRNA processing protein RimM
VTDWVSVGRVGRPHGVHGAFFVENASEDPERFAAGATVWVGGEPATVVESKVSGGRRVIRLDPRPERGAELAVPRDALPPPDENEWYAFELVGLTVVEEGGRTLGRVAEVQPGAANDVLALEDGTLLPFVDACVLDVDTGSGTIVVARGFADPIDA